MLEQGALPGWTDAWNLVERGSVDRLLAAGTVGADGEAMGLVAERLDAIEHGIARLEQQRLAPLEINALAPGVAVGSLATAATLMSVRPSSSSTAVAAESCPGPPSISTRWARPIRWRVLVARELAEAPCEHLPHHGVIVPRGKVLGAMLNFRY